MHVSEINILYNPYLDYAKNNTYTNTSNYWFMAILNNILWSTKHVQRFIKCALYKKQRASTVSSASVHK